MEVLLMKQSMLQIIALGIFSLGATAPLFGMRSSLTRRSNLSYLSFSLPKNHLGSAMRMRLTGSVTRPTTLATQTISPAARLSFVQRLQNRVNDSLVRAWPKAKFVLKSTLFAGSVGAAAYAGSEYGIYKAKQDAADLYESEKKKTAHLQAQQLNQAADEQAALKRKLHIALAEKKKIEAIEQQKKQIVSFLEVQDIAQGIESTESNRRYNADLILAANNLFMEENNEESFRALLEQTFKQDPRILQTCLQKGIESVLPDLKTRTEQAIINNFSQLAQTDAGKGVVLTYIKSFATELQQKEINQTAMSQLDILILNHFDQLVEVKYEGNFWNNKIVNNPELGHRILCEYIKNRFNPAVASAISRSALHQKSKAQLQITQAGNAFLKEAALIA